MKPATIDSLQAIKLQALVKADSLSTIRVNQLTQKLDSMQKVVEKTEIGQGYFSDIISLQLGVFLGILGLLAFVSWSGIVYLFQKEMKKMDKKILENSNRMEGALSNHIINIESKLSEHSGKVAGDIGDIKIDNGLNEIRIYDAMAWVSYSEKNYFLSFIWQLRSFEVQINMKYSWNSNVDVNNSNISTTKELPQIIDYSTVHQAGFNETQNIFRQIRASEVKGFQTFKKELLVIEEEFNKRYYQYLASIEPSTP